MGTPQSMLTPDRTPTVPFIMGPTIDEIAKQVAEQLAVVWQSNAIDPNVAQMSATLQHEARRNSKLRLIIMSLSGLASLLLGVAGVQTSYIRGYDERERAESSVRIQPKSTKEIDKIEAYIANDAPTSRDLAELQAMTQAVSQLQLEQQDYFVVVLEAISNRRRIPGKPPTLLQAEFALRRAMRNRGSDDDE